MNLSFFPGRLRGIGGLFGQVDPVVLLDNRVVIMKIMRSEKARSIKGVTFKSEMTANLFVLLKSLAMLGILPRGL